MLLARYSKQELNAICELEGPSWVQQQIEAKTLLGKTASPGEIEALTHWLNHRQQMGGLKAKTEQDDAVRAAVTLAMEANDLAAKANVAASKANGVAALALLVAIAAVAVVMNPG